MADIKALKAEYEKVTIGFTALTDYTRNPKKVAEQKAIMKAADALVEKTRVLEKEDKATYDALKPAIDKFTPAYEKASDAFAKAELARAHDNGDDAGRKLTKEATEAGKNLRTMIGNGYDFVKSMFDGIGDSVDTSNSTEKSDGLNWKALLGGGVGGIAGYFLGSMFGDGIMGKIAGILLAFGGFFMGRDFAGKHFGGSDAAAPSTGAATTPAKMGADKKPVVEKDLAQEERARQQVDIDRMVALHFKMQNEKKLAPISNTSVNPTEPFVPNVTKSAGQNQGASLKI